MRTAAQLHALYKDVAETKGTSLLNSGHIKGLSRVARAVISEIELDPAPGWFQFGTHLDETKVGEVRLEFWGEEHSDDGMPMWERPIEDEVKWEYTVGGHTDVIFPSREAAEQYNRKLISLDIDPGDIFMRQKPVPGEWMPA